ncbi:hypothetical protein ACFQ1I_46835 [Kitasatospora arboriphila]
MPARVRTKRRSSHPAIRVSALRPSTYNLRPGEARTIVCPDCQTWQRIMGATTLTIRDHHATDLPGAELEAYQTDRRCPSARRVVLVDLTTDEIARWQRVQDRWISPDAMLAETRRAARQHYKLLPPQAPAVHQIAERRETVPAPTNAERAEQWRRRLPAVLVADTLRSIPLHDAVGPIRGVEVPTEKPSRAA